MGGSEGKVEVRILKIIKILEVGRVKRLYEGG